MTGNANFTFNDVAILSIEAIDAPEVVTSADIDERLAPFYERTDTRPGLLESLAGITQRRQWHEGTSFMDAAAMAGEKAIEASGIDRSRIGVMIDTSVCRERLEPSSAVSVHDELNLSSSCMNFDLSNACLGFMNGMHLAGSMLEAGQLDYVLLVDGEGTREIHDNTISRLLDESSTADDLFSNFASLTLGSGAAAMVLGRQSENPGSHRIVGGYFRAATMHQDLCVGDLEHMRTDTRGLLEAGTELVKRSWDEIEDNERWRHDMKYYVLHQVSQVHTQAVLDTLGIDSDRVPRTFPHYGNIGPAAVPVTLAAIQTSLSTGDGVLLAGIGSGLNSSFIELQW
jgi:3-oxoacyl-[acyl-carrier-protein] synthase III